MKERVRLMQLSMALLVHRSVVNPRLNRPGLTARIMAEISLLHWAAFFPAILDRVAGCLTFTFLLRQETTFWKLAPPYCQKEVQVSAMWSNRRSWNSCSTSRSWGLTWGLKKSSFGLFGSESEGSPFLFFSAAFSASLSALSLQYVCHRALWWVSRWRARPVVLLPLVASSFLQLMHFPSSPLCLLKEILEQPFIRSC